MRRRQKVREFMLSTQFQLISLLQLTIGMIWQSRILSLLLVELGLPSRRVPLLSSFQEPIMQLDRRSLSEGVSRTCLFGY